MRSVAGICTALLLWSAACGGDEDTEGSPGAGQPATEGGSPAAPDDASGGWSPVDAGDARVDSAPDSGDVPVEDAGPTLMLDIPKSIVPCGDVECETLDKVCCGGWTKGQGFAPALSCIPRSECSKQHQRSGETNRVVAHECDGKEDCSGGQVCCFYGDGAPMCELVDILACHAKPIGPGGGRICADADRCVVGYEGFIVEGIPLGVLSCNDDTDCSDRPGTHCQPEESNSMSTGKGVPARDYIKVCR